MELFKFEFFESFFWNIIFMSTFSIPSPICISFFFNWIWIQFNWIQISIRFKLHGMSSIFSFKLNLFSQDQFIFSSINQSIGTHNA
jgi:hypothetical protein